MDYHTILFKKQQQDIDSNLVLSSSKYLSLTLLGKHYLEVLHQHQSTRFYLPWLLSTLLM